MQNAPVAQRRTVVITLWQFVLIGGLLAFYWLLTAAQINAPANTDYTRFYFSAYQALHHRPQYAPVEPALFGASDAEFAQSLILLSPPVHMPQITAAYLPFVRLPFAQSFRLWTFLSVVAALGACAMLWRMLYGSQARTSTLLWMWIVMLAFYPTFTALRLGQTTMILFFLVTAGWWAARRGRSRWAGVAFGLAVSLRTFAGLLLVYFLIKRQWRMLLWSSITFALTIVASLPFVGAEAYQDWLAVTQGVDWQARNWNASLAGFFARILPPQPALLLTAGCSIFWLALLVWLSWPRPQAQPGRNQDDLTFSLALALMLLLSPLGWMYYFPILFVGVFVLWRQTADDSLRPLRWALLPAWLLSNIPTVQHPISELTDPLGWWTWNSVYFYALLIFCSLLACLAARGERVTR